jgi:hypothetical protein
VGRSAYSIQPSVRHRVGSGHHEEVQRAPRRRWRSPAIPHRRLAGIGWLVVRRSQCRRSQITGTTGRAIARKRSARANSSDGACQSGGGATEGWREGGGVHGCGGAAGHECEHAGLAAACIWLSSNLPGGYGETQRRQARLGHRRACSGALRSPPMAIPSASHDPRTSAAGSQPTSPRCPRTLRQCPPSNTTWPRTRKRRSMKSTNVSFSP